MSTSLGHDAMRFDGAYYFIPGVVYLLKSWKRTHVPLAGLESVRDQ